MDRICQYSTIIFAGNVSVLLIVAISTDYWEYRGFRTADLIPHLKKMHNRLRLVFPSDTSSYFVVKYYWDPPPVKTSIFATTPAPKREKIVANYTLVYYQPPALLIKKLEDYIVFEDSIHFDGEKNVTVSMPTKKTRPLEDKLVLYIQYTNLFRECDILEAGVRARLGLSILRHHRCFNFITHNRQNDFISLELPAAMHLERIAFTMSLICIAVSILSLVSGAYGSISRNKCYILTASSAACASGIAMTISIAIFHGKCHLIHRHEFLAGVELPFKKTVEEHREHYYGWSFVLAWICVILCFVHTWVWLVKAQDMPDLCFPPRRKWTWKLFPRKRRRRRRRRKKNLVHGGRRARRVGDNSLCNSGNVILRGHPGGMAPSSGTTPSPFLLLSSRDINNEENQYAVIPDGESVTYNNHVDNNTSSTTAVNITATVSTAVSTATMLTTADFCPPCGRSLARTNGILKNGPTSIGNNLNNIGNSHVGNQCRGLSKSAGNFLFLSARAPETDEYRILNRPPDEFKVLVRPSETLKAFSADTLNFP